MSGNVGEAKGDLAFLRLRQLHGSGNQGGEFPSGDDFIRVRQPVGVAADDAFFRQDLNGFLRPMPLGILKIPVYRIGAARKQGKHKADSEGKAQRPFHFLIHKRLLHSAHDGLTLLLLGGGFLFLRGGLPLGQRLLISAEDRLVKLCLGLLGAGKADILVLAVSGLIAWHGDKQPFRALHNFDAPHGKIAVDIDRGGGLAAALRTDGVDFHIVLGCGRCRVLRHGFFLLHKISGTVNRRS
ncbi:hypothetical protein SDC9_55590 [bioreactor metagenome]|uniref:Uncharacterized protein n=1 Tax=bioreactor metagenome TaxID=1076179 RepID=A0A644X564_9ZZZZ